MTTSPYRIPGDFYYWAGNGAFANWGMLFMQAFRLTHDASYYNAAIATLDYLMGKNATTYCFVTGQGSKNPKHIHHRISSADGVAEPVPGLLVCGADPGDNSDCGASSYPSTFPAKCYLDSECSYSTNEVAIGLNSAIAFLAGAVQAEYLLNFTDSMPEYFSISKTRITMPYKIGNDVQLVIEGNTHWELVPSEDWILISELSGTGNATLNVNCKTDNPTETERSGKIYVYSQSVLTDSILVTQNGVRKSFRIEAEDYLEMSGIQTEATADVDGNENIGFVNINDWVTYSLDITSEGIYTVVFRHAGYAGNFNVSIDDNFLQTVKFPKTADWQVWDSYTTEMALPEGQHIMKFTFKGDGTNLNWYQFDWNRGLDIKSKKTDGFRIFPNPAKELIYFEYENEMEPMEITIYTIDGKMVLQPTIQGASKKQIDVSKLNAGLYLLKIQFASCVLTESLIIR
jgi:hypothetical protein